MRAKNALLAFIKGEGLVSLKNVSEQAQQGSLMNLSGVAHYERVSQLGGEYQLIDEGRAEVYYHPIDTQI